MRGVRITVSLTGGMTTCSAFFFALPLVSAVPRFACADENLLGDNF